MTQKPYLFSANSSINSFTRPVALLLGQKYGFAEEGFDYEKFSNTVPVATYDEIKPWIERMLKG